MKKYAKIKTGFNFLDQKWGGIYKGGNYLIIGSRKTGKSILALNIIEHIVQENLFTLLLTSERNKSLEIKASSIYFDIEEAIKKGNLLVERISSKFTNLDELLKFIEEKEPSFLIFDEIVNENFNWLKEDYINFLEFLENQNITSFFISSLPKTETDKNFIRMIAKNSTGIIQLRKIDEKMNYSGTVSIKPNIGHFEGEFETTYKIEPVKGFITLADNEKSIFDMLTNSDKSQLINKKESFQYSNLYSVEEFEFLIANKTSLSQTTDEELKILVYEINDSVLSPIELYKVIKEKLDNSDKVCLTEKSVYLFPEIFNNELLQKLSNSVDERIKQNYGQKIEFGKQIIKRIYPLKKNFEIK